jgi:hypothetical protein
LTKLQPANSKAALVPLSKTPLNVSIVAEKPLDESLYIQKTELDPSIVKETRAKENQNRMNAGLWAEIAGGYLDEITFLNFLETNNATPLGGGYYTLPTDSKIHWVGVRYVYGGAPHLIHAVLEKALDNALFGIVYSDLGGDVISYGQNFILVRSGETWSAIDELKPSKSLKVLNEVTDTVVYFTDGENIYVMYGNRPYEGCCAIMTENMFKVLGADLPSFEIIDKSTARDKNYVYTATVSEKGGVELSISIEQTQETPEEVSGKRGEAEVLENGPASVWVDESIYKIMFIEERDYPEFMAVKPENRLSFLQTLEISDDIGSGYNGGYFTRVLSNTEYDIFSYLPLEKGGAPYGLFKYQKHTKEMREMNASNYHHVQRLSQFSPDNTKIISTDGLELGFVDIESDIYVPIKTLDVTGNERFNGGCEMMCEGRLEWINNQQVKVRVYEFNKCDATCEPYYAEKWNDVIYDVKPQV